MSKVCVNFAKAVRPVGMMHGMNNGPFMHQGDFGPEYDEAGIPFVRFHETHSPTTKCIEVPFIFRDFDADENDEKNYFFGATDKVITEAVKHGITVMYRLGMGTESSSPRLFSVVPKDAKKWARICVNIIRHYNEGWANGFHYNIPYWEIWNEADLQQYWPGTVEQFNELYEEASLAIRAYDPNLKVGGYAAADLDRKNELYEAALPTFHANDSNLKADSAAAKLNSKNSFAGAFLQNVVDKNLPLDFLSWHFYRETLEGIHFRCDFAEAILKQYGLHGKVENINSEWHGIALRKRPTTEKGIWGGWDLSKSGQVCSAVCNVAAMILMQQHNVTKAAYYDAENRGALCGLWDVHMHKQKQFYGFKAFNYLYQAGTEYESVSDNFDLQAMAAADEKKGYLLLANYTEEADTVALELNNMPGADMQVYLLDETRSLETAVDSDSFGAAESVKREIKLPAMSVALIELQFR